MTLIKRISSLFKADMHGILDSLEDPGLALKYAVREMQAAIVEDENKLQQLAQQIVSTQSALASSEGRYRDLNGQIELCFEAEDQLLAKSLIRKRLEQERHRECLSKKVIGLEERSKNLATAIATKKDQLLGVTQKMEVLARSDKETVVAGYCQESIRQSLSTVTDEEVEVAFLAEAKKRSEKNCSVENR